MARAKVVYLDEYRKARQQKNLLEMIKGHLAEAGLLGKCSSAGGRGSKNSAGRNRLYEADKGTPEGLSSNCTAAKELPDA
jgi:hypothetical protein